MPTHRIATLAAIFGALMALDTLSAQEINTKLEPVLIDVDKLSIDSGTEKAAYYNPGAPIGPVVVDLFSGWASNCAILQDSQGRESVKCWGANFSGVLGQGHTQHIGDDPGELQNMPPIPLPPHVNDISIGGNFACATYSKSSGGTGLKCWGENNFGQLGLGHTGDMGDQPGEISNLPDVYFPAGETPMYVSAGNSHVCTTIRERMGTHLIDSVKCWGRNFAGILGFANPAWGPGVGDTPGEMANLGTLGPVDFAYPLTSSPSVQGVHKVSTGIESSCGLFKDNSLKCWGNNSGGELGQETTATFLSIPTNFINILHPVSSSVYHLPSIIEIDSYLNGHCALFSTGDVKCWGSGQWAVHGQGTWATLGDDPGEMSSLGSVPLGRPAVSISIDRDSSCALLDNGDVRCWGDNFTGALGLSNGNAGAYRNVGGGIGSTPISSVAPVALGQPAIKITSGARHHCALLLDRTVKCWGDNAHGQLGQGHNRHLGDDANEISNIPPIQF